MKLQFLELPDSERRLYIEQAAILFSRSYDSHAQSVHRNINRQ